MAKILDPDTLTYSVNSATNMLRFDTTAKTIQLVAGGALVAKDGVTGQCLFSKIKEVIKASSVLISVPLPVREMIHDESMELVNGWTFADATTLKMIRDCGVAYISATAPYRATAMFACFVSLGAIPAAVADASIYFTQSSATNASTSTFTHVNKDTTFGVNELVQIYSDTNGDGTPDYDYRAYAKVFLRAAGYTYDEASSVDIGYPALTYKKYNFPLTCAIDAGVTKNDATVDAYTGMSITWGATTGVYLGANGPYAFHVTVNGNTHTHDEIYSWVQRQLRLASDIDAAGGTARNGNVAAALVFMDGATLKTKLQDVGGVHVSNIAAASYNFIKEADDGGVYRNYPLSVSVVLEFDSYLQGDADAYFWIFKTADYGTPGATPILDSSAAQMKGAANIASTSFAYNHTVDVPLTGVALGKSGAKIALATGSITAAGAKLVFVAGLERWYANP
jgi:hypothetical protein